MGERALPDFDVCQHQPRQAELAFLVEGSYEQTVWGVRGVSRSAQLETG